MNPSLQQEAEKILKTGTTTVGVIARDAVVIATEMKSTMGFQVASKYSKKIYRLDDHIGMTIAGSSGDAQFVVKLLRAQYKLYRLERGSISVKAAANLLANILQGSKYFPYYNLFILGGYDSKGPALYSVDMIGGFDWQDNFYATGSGSPYAYGVLESQYKENLAVDDAIVLCIRAIRAAIERDIGSGGRGFSVSVIDKSGYRELAQTEIRKFAA